MVSVRGCSLDRFEIVSLPFHQSTNNGHLGTEKRTISQRDDLSSPVALGGAAECQTRGPIRLDGTTG